MQIANGVPLYNISTITIPSTTIVNISSTSTVGLNSTTLVKFSSTSLVTISSTSKVDLNSTATVALNSTTNTKLQNIFNETESVEHHLHVNEVWLGKSTGPSTGTDWAAVRNVPWRVHSGANAYSTGSTHYARVLGASDTPVDTSNTLFDPHRLLISGVSNDNPFRIRLVASTGTLAQGIAAKTYGEVMIKFDSASPQQSAGIPVDILMKRKPVGTKIYAQCMSTADNAYVDFFIGLHEYTS